MLMKKGRVDIEAERDKWHCLSASIYLAVTMCIGDAVSACQATSQEVPHPRRKPS